MYNKLKQSPPGSAFSIVNMIQYLQGPQTDRDRVSDGQPPYSELFDEGVAAFAADDSNLKRFGQFGRDDGAFVFPKHVADAMVKEADGDPRVLEALLGLNPGSLGENPIMIQPNKVDNLRIPSGNEGGAKDNIQWRPGGKTYPGSVPEAVINPVPINQIKVTKLWK